MTGIHPTLETIVAQIALLSIYVVGILYVLVWKPKKEQAIMQARKSRASMNESV
jgi:high-affinity iron transporter